MRRHVLKDEYEGEALEARLKMQIGGGASVTPCAAEQGALARGPVPHSAQRGTAPTCAVRAWVGAAQ